MHLGQLFVVSFFFILDVFFALWLAHFHFRLPESMKYISKALVGWGAPMRDAFDHVDHHPLINKGKREDKPNK